MTSNRYAAGEDLIRAVIGQESSGDTNAVSPKGATGLMQLMPPTAREVAGKLGLPFDEGRLKTDPEYNKTLGTAYLNEQLSKYGGNTALALAAYNGGPGSVDKWLKTIGDPRTGAISNQAFVDAIPFGETKDYVNRIQAKLAEGGDQRPLADAVGDYNTTFPLPTDITREQQREADAAAPDFASAAWEAVSEGQTLTWMLRGNEKFLPQEGYVLEGEPLKELSKGIPTEYLHSLEGAHSPAHAEYLRQGIVDQMARSAKVASLGWTGVGISTLSAIVDPVGILAGIASGGLGALATKGAAVGRLGRALYTGVATGAVEAGLAAYRVDKNPLGEDQEILWAALGGFGFGAAFGALSHNAATAAERLAMEGTARHGQQALELEARGLGRGTAGATAAADASISPLREDVPSFLAISDAEAPRSGRPWFNWSRWDVSAQGKASDIALTRALAERLVEDPVGNADRGVVAAEHASRTMDTLRSRMGAQLARSWRPAFKGWLAEQSIPWRKRWTAQVDFDRQVGEFIRDQDITRIPTYSPHVKAAGEALRTALDDYAELGFNPGAIDGRTLRSLPGFEKRPANRFYLPRIFDHANINRVLANLGEPAVVGVIRQAIRDAQPEIEAALAGRIAAGYFKRIRSLGAGMEVDFSQRWSGESLDLLREELGMVGDLTQGEIDGILKVVGKEPEGGTPRGKPRLLLNEATTVTVPDPYTGAMQEVCFSDLLVKDASVLFEAYSRHMSGQIALARVQIKDVNGDLLVDGIRTKGELSKLLDRVRAVGDHLGIAGGKVKDDTNVLQWMFDRVAGIPDAAQTTKAAEYLRLLRDFNYVRVMNQSGFAQVAEIGNIIGQLGIKAALEGMPALGALRRRLINGEATLVDELAADIEAMTGHATDHLRGISHERWEVDAPPSSVASERPWVRTASNLLERGKQVTSNISGMTLVNTVTQRWTAKAIAHKFAALAQGSGTANMNRLRAVGLSEEMLERVLGQMREHGSWTQGTMAKLRRINPDAWTDQEALAHFETAVAGWSKRIIQENDPGAMAMWMSKPAAQIVTQFRTFMLGAWSKTLLHNIHMRDTEALASFTGTMVFGGLVYMLQTNLQAIGRSDRKEWLEERLSVLNIAKAGFQRAGFSSLFPMIADTGARVAGQDPLFDFRTTGSASNMLFGNPTVDLMDNALKGLGGLSGAAGEGRPPSQADARSLLRLLPFSNFLPIASIYNAMIRDLPERRGGN